MSAQAFAAVSLAGALLADPAHVMSRMRLASVLGLPTLNPAVQRFTANKNVTLSGVAAASAALLITVVWSGPISLCAAMVAAVTTYFACRKLLNFTRLTTSTDETDALRLAANWDLLAACLRSGMPVVTAIRAVAPALPVDAGRALGKTAELMSLGADPADAWAPAQAHPVTAALARGARRTARSGAALAEVADSLATTVRASAADLAQARAQRAGVHVTGPLGLCFLPAFLCLGVVPVVIGLASQMLSHWQ